MRLTVLAFLAAPLLLVACGSGSQHGTGGHGGQGGHGTTGTAGHGGTTGTGGSAPACGDGAWETYGHDAQRTSASDGCVTGPLTLTWAYAPTAPDGRMVQQLLHPLATKDAAFLHWSATNPPYLGTTAADRVDLDGKRVWTFDTGTDAEFGDWGSLWKSNLALQSDGVYLVDQTDGHKVASTGVDWWGQSIPTSAALYISNTSKSDGPGLFVAALDETAQVTWKQNELGTQCGEALADQTGGIALDGGTLFYAPRYATGSMTQPSFSSGVYAFDTQNGGKPIWSIGTSPQSAISAGGGNVYLVESDMTGAKLVARRQSDGAIAWSADLMGGAGVQAPVLADGKVIVAGLTGVLAFAQADGKPAWTSQASAYTYGSQLSVSNGCGGLQPLGNLPVTSIAVALGSGTVVIAQGQMVTLLSLADGTQLWQGTPEGVQAGLANPIVVGRRVYVIEQAGPTGRLLALSGQP